MDSKDLLKIQTQRGAKAVGHETVAKTVDVVINECRDYIEENSDKYRNLEANEKREAIKKIIVDFVMSTKPMVIGYVSSDNVPDTIKLTDRLVEDITDYGILTAAMTDTSINEIRCNGRELKVEIHGRVRDLKDRDGHILSFDSVEQQQIVMKKLLGSIRLTPKDQLVNSRTIEGYRIAAVHSSALGDDPNDPTGEKYDAFVLRKFNKNKLTLSDIVGFKSMSDNMARLLALTVAGGLTTLCAGPTASGKTSLLNALLQSVHSGSRLVILQNPSEMDVRKRDSSGRVYNDVLHMEATEKEHPTEKDATMENAAAQILRLSPNYVCLGEMRTNTEFALGMMIMGAGHPLYASLHAENSKGVVSRFLRGYMAASNERIETALPGLTDLLNIVVIQKIMKDGTRKILQVSEVLGVDPADHNSPLINDLYIFEPTGEPVYDVNGEVIDIPGVHKRVGVLSNDTVRKLRMEGVKRSRFDFMMKDVSADEVEEYTGKNIDNYGM